MTPRGENTDKYYGDSIMAAWRQKRTCAGQGTWQGQGKGKRKPQQEEGLEEVKKKLRVHVRGSAETMEIEWDKYALNFHEHGVGHARVLHHRPARARAVAGEGVLHPLQRPRQERQEEQQGCAA